MPDDHLIPKVELSGFELQRRLGAGGMAEVFLAKKRGAEGTFKQLVVKRILPEHASSRRFRNMFVEEAQLATRLNHPNIVQVYEFSHHGEDELLLSMEYVEGIDLGQLIRAARHAGTVLSPPVAAFIAAEVAKGLHYAHERRDEGGPLDIVHRDVSPQNVLLSYDGVVKIADFGIASANLFRQETGVLKGKFAYMSPEQARGEKVDRRSDIYALGVVLYEMLSGKSPYGSLKDTALTDAVRRGTIKPLPLAAPDLPPELVKIVERAVAHRPADRFPTARRMASAISRHLLEEQQLVDAVTIEQTLATLREHDDQRPGQDSELSQQTLAAIRRPRSSVAGTTGGGTRHFGSQRIVREVRHVAMLTLHLHGLDALEKHQGAAVARRTLASTRTTLDDIAFKHFAVWSWESEVHAKAIVGLMANPSRAPVDAGLIAVDVHDFLAGLSEDLPVPLQAAVSVVRGIAAGERDAAGHLVHHDLAGPVEFLGQQISSRTPSGATWVAGGVYRLVRREFVWEHGPTLEIEADVGQLVPQQLRVYALLRRITSEERLAELSLSQTDLVGRDAEKADLHAAYHRAVYHPGLSSPPPASGSEPAPPSARSPRAAGELLVRVVVGEMGIGKTALIDAFLAELPNSAGKGECRAFRVECSPVKLDLPYATVRDLMHEVMGLSRDEPFDAIHASLERLLGDADGRGPRLVKTLAELMAGQEPHLLDEDTASHHHDLIARGVRYVFGAFAARSPVVVVIDGLQWADAASLAILQQIIERDEALPVLTVLVTRPHERLNPFIEGLVRIELRGLEPEQQIRLVQTRLGVREGVAAVCRELVPRVGGNPYFLLEMIDAMLESGALEIEPGGPDDSGSLQRREPRPGAPLDALPRTIEQLVGDRLAELPPAEHDIVDWLAVAGGPLAEADLMVLTRLADDEAITRLCARGLCDRKGNALDFRHALARDVAYGALEPVQRARKHRRLGEHLATTPLASGLSAAIVAQHLERGQAPRQAAEHYLEAAQAARGAHQTQLALRYFHRALDQLPVGDHRRLQAHAALERIHRHLGQHTERRQHLDELRRLARESRLARWLALALTRSAQLELEEGAAARGLPLAQRATDMARVARTPELEVEALVTLGELLRDVGDINGALDACERALVVAADGQVPARARAEVLRAKGVLTRRTGRVRAAIEAYAEAIAIFNMVGARRSEARARNALGFGLFVLGRYEDAVAMCLSSIEIDLMIGGRFQVAKTLANIGMAYARLGDPDHGLAYLERARDAHERYDDQDGRVDTLLVTAGVLAEVGRLTEAGAMLAEANAVGAVSGNVYDRVHERIVSALLLHARGDWQSACAHASEARRLAEGQGLMSYHVYATALEGQSRVRLGDAQAGLLLATTAFGAIEALEGSEYGVEVRALCCDTMHLATSGDSSATYDPSLLAEICRRALGYVERIGGHIHDESTRARFDLRPPVRRLRQIAERALSGAAGAAPSSPP